MEGPTIVLLLLLGFISSSYNWTLSEVRVRPGENITLYCDCKTSTGVYIVWFRNCSHENQPTLVLKVLEITRKKHTSELLNPLQFELVNNSTSESYDLMIINVTETDEGLYYCGKEIRKVEDKNEQMGSTYTYTYGNITRLRIDSHEPLPDFNQTQQGCDVCWKLFYIWCPAVSVLSACFSSLLVCLLLQKTVNTPHKDLKISNTKSPREATQDEDVCYAALEVHQASHRSMRTRTQRSDFSTYSAIKTSQV
ncbi:uncharacterized protein LOC121638959 isoform X2 [Melanotaenia boesemani]|uniref:uncharacterized protein LOC121638959 isoform X2 n=1 Tax=Melanotaenia boesemani TaxID=1250792 RepID=UPI001C0515B6|nr:uncharacterized protein LOC121638959 isoform X2 [Melanotaenia boesemani]